jgi:hypothetical protein
MSQQANLNRSKGQPQAKPIEFNPFAKKATPRQATPDEIRKLLGPNWHEVKT